MRDSFNEINITPLTDIFLVLLIIMMVVAPLLDQQGLNLAVPEIVNKEQVLKDPKIMNFSITEDGKYYFEDNVVSVNDVDKIIAKRMKDFPDGMLIQVNENTEHGKVVKLMDIARNVGVKSISLAR